MKIELTKFLFSLSTALDYVEAEIVRCARNHGKRVGILTNRMAKAAGMDRDTVFILTQAAILHDCALSEYLKEELTVPGAQLDERGMKDHCLMGENMLSKLPAYRLIPGAVLYHHERADGNGAFGVTDAPLTAQLIHMADVVDVRFDLETMDREKFDRITDWLRTERGTCFTGECGDLFAQAADYETLCAITGESCRPILRGMLPEFADEVSAEILREMAGIFARITDYKSHFTWRHSLGIAEKAEQMGRFYRYDQEMCDKLYIAGALHDIGKLLIHNDILEKPGKLTNEEYREIQNHAMGTWELLKNIGGLEDITRWAARHHEKLNGSGYPFGLTADALDKNDRLLACLDIYQALVEERPYKAGLPHEEAMEILNRMGDSGQLDTEILADVDRCFGGSGASRDDAAEPDTSAAAEPEDLPSAGERWRCPVCGYICEGALPEDFICPRCEQPAAIFEKVSG